MALHDINHLSLNGATYIAEHVANFARACKLTGPGHPPVAMPASTPAARTTTQHPIMPAWSTNVTATAAALGAEVKLNGGKGALVAPNAEHVAMKPASKWRWR